MRSEMTRAIRFTLATMLLFGGAYPVALWALGRAAFREQADGSLIRRADGTIAGSRLIAQAFERPEYFHPRPSAVDYDAGAAGGSNYGPSNPEQLKAVKARLDAIMALERVPPNRVPSEMVTASGSGLDPDIPPDAAALQAPRVARARGVAVDRVQALVAAHTQAPAWGFFGRPRVNVLELNLALDAALGAPAAAR
jgi:potassium-transporting ATPase KdpC subunit